MYTTNPRMPKVRREAARMVRKGYSTREVARHFGFSQRAVAYWARKAVDVGDHPILTKSSRPRTSPKRLSKEVRDIVSNKRKELGRSIEVVHHAVKQEGLDISLSSVYRILKDRYLLKRKSPWKKLHYSSLRPEALKPGDLVQMDTIHLMINKKQRIYVYTLVDLYSRIGYAQATTKISSSKSLLFLRKARTQLSFQISCIQTDNGPEFGSYFTQRVDTVHRHSRIRKPNDNAHIERFNRTIQDECLNKVSVDVSKINKALKNYIHHYNNTRAHFSLNFRSPQVYLSEHKV
jgi:transposase InsO family protein